MRKIALWEAKNPRKVILIALLLLIPAIIGFICTRVNYNVMSYLPEDLDAVKGEVILDEVFNNAGMSIVMVEDMPAKYTSALKERIGEVDGVKDVIWIDSITDIDIPPDMLPDMMQEVFYGNDSGKTMMLVRYSQSGESDITLNAIKDIKGLLNEQCFITGFSAIIEDTKEICETQAPIYIAVAIALALIVMAVMMESWLQPFVILAALGLAVAYNMGTNFFRGSISFITRCVAAVLQLGVTMDYSIFLIDRYHEELPKYSSKEEAMAEAVSQSFSALIGSSLTTVFGFAALCFMKLRLGFDIGFVMAKGVMFGILVVLFVLPSILIILDGPMQKYKHRSFTISFRDLSAFVLKRKKLFAIIFAALLLPTCLLQSRIEKYYNMDKGLPEYLPSIEGLNELKNEYGMTCMQFVIVDDSLPADKLVSMENEISRLDGINMVLAYNSIVGPSVPDDIIPDEIIEICKQGGLQMFMVNSELDQASAEMTAQLKQMDKIVKSYDENGIITGEGALSQALMDTTSRDFAVTAILSTIAVFILIAVVFKSISLPFILVLSIELAIWINLSITVLMGKTASFVDPTVVNCVQLGATVDYAILLTTRFREQLQNHPTPVAISRAVNMSMKSIVQSAAVFFVVCFGVYFVCDIYIVRGMCMLLARGAIISALVMVLFLAPVLCLGEKLISKTTKEWR